MRSFLFSFLLGALCGSAMAGDLVFASGFDERHEGGATRVHTVIVDTPERSYTFAECQMDAIYIVRYGTTFTMVTYCGTPQSAPQVPGWQPSQHPDGGVFLWEGQARVGGGASDVFSECILWDHWDDEFTGTYLTIIECLEDPY